MSGRFTARAEAVAEVAAKYADEVDEQGRGPVEAVAAMREQRLLGVAVPAELGGEGASLRELSEITTIIGTACGNSGMLYAMHQSQAEVLWRHPAGAEIFAFIDRVRDEQLLLASSTTERGIGGNARQSLTCFERPAPGRVSVVKDASVLSYVEIADATLVTARRDADAPGSVQQVLVCPAEDTQLERTGTWNALGMRGTASNGYIFRAEVSEGMLLPDEYSIISPRTMLPVTHILWASAWLGIATSACNHARATVRRLARGRIGEPPPSQLRLAELLVTLQAFADTVHGAADRFDRAANDPEELDSYGFALAMNAIKIYASETVLELTTRALGIVGIAGYRLGEPHSLSRNLRDSLGAAVQISNDRLLDNSGALALLATVEQ